MLEAVNLVFTISLKRSTPNLQLSTSSPADYPILWHKADIPVRSINVRFRGESETSGAGASMSARRQPRHRDFTIGNVVIDGFQGQTLAGSIRIHVFDDPIIP